jgi:hypothetical protein
VLVDLVGLEHNVRDTELAIDLIRINVFKKGAYTRRSTAVEFESIASIATLNRRRQVASPYKLCALPPQWGPLSVLLGAATDPDTLMRVFAAVLHRVKDKHAHSVWAVSMLQLLIAEKEPSSIPPQVIESILDMCVANKDLYSIIEVLGLVRERGIPLPEAVWSRVMTATWHAGTYHMNAEARDRVFSEVLLLL